MIADSHCHLDFYKDEEIADIIENAHKVNIKYLHTISTKLEEFDNIINICKSYKNIYCSVGIHPNNVKSEDKNYISELINLAKHEKVISIGESGLDYYHNFTDKILQQDIFKLHIKVAEHYNLPVIVHSRDAEEDTIKILESEVKKVPIILHSFASSEILFEAALKNNWYVSFSGIVTFKNANNIQEIAKRVPDDKLLIETDAPYLAPVPKRGKKNYPEFIIHTMDFLKNLRNQPDLDKIIMKNFLNVFKKIRPE
jgi:TatD DNase family protein